MRVLFVCVHNSARSQMAEAFLNALAGDRFEAASAGLEPEPLNPARGRSHEGSRDRHFDRTRPRASSRSTRAGPSSASSSRSATPKPPSAVRPFPGITRTLVWSFPDPASFAGLMGRAAGQDEAGPRCHQGENREVHRGRVGGKTKASTSNSPS
ncbi:MAG: hypothetical protein MZV63_65665 [Marinilabiliales bacterium]|nr:hypothetical protein [Marinilabiliales bacterium]